MRTVMSYCFLPAGWYFVKTLNPINFNIPEVRKYTYKIK